MKRSASWVVAWAALVGGVLGGACDAARPVIDPVPFEQKCTLSPNSCPAPYVCAPSAALTNPPKSPPDDLCFVPCPDGDGDCAEGFLCNAPPHQVADYSAPANCCYRPAP